MSGFPSAAQYKNYNDGRGPSAALWADLPPAVRYDMNAGIFFEDDFLNFSQHISAQNVQQYASYIDTGVTIKQLATDIGGVIEVAGNDADNDEGSITTGGNTAGMVKVCKTLKYPVWFEARVKKASIADNALAFFLGLAEEGVVGAEALVDDTGEVADKDLIGFQSLHADGDALVFCYRKAGQAKQTIALDTASAVLTAATWVKVGFKYVPNAPEAKRLQIFVDGVRQAAFGTQTNLDATTFPDAEELALLWATKVGTAAESKTQLDWWRVALSY